MILELIAFIIVLAASTLLLLIFFTIGDYIKSKNNKEVITRTPLNSTIDELYKQSRKRK